MEVKIMEGKVMEVCLCVIIDIYVFMDSLSLFILVYSV